MMVRIQVQESSLSKIELGQEVSITVDALQGKQFTGKVSRVAPLPDATSVWMNPDLKVYDTDIMIDGVHADLRTGMSCRAKVMVNEYPDAISVPMQAVVGKDGRSFVYVVKGKSSEAREVKIGQNNNAMVVVEDGLAVGETVLLTPPLGDDALPSSDESVALAP